MQYKVKQRTVHLQGTKAQVTRFRDGRRGWKGICTSRGNSSQNLVKLVRFWGVTTVLGLVVSCYQQIATPGRKAKVALA